MVLSGIGRGDMKFETTSAALAVAILFGGVALAQGTLADYERAQGLQAKARGLVVNQPGAANWIGEWITSGTRRPLKGARNSFWWTPRRRSRAPFHHEKLAAAINAVTGGRFDVGAIERGTEHRGLRHLAAIAAADATIVDRGDRIVLQRIVGVLDRQRGAARQADAGVVSGADVRDRRRSAP